MAGSRGHYRDALRSRDLRLLLTAFALDEIGGWAYKVVLIVFVYDQTGSPTMIVATTACSWVPRLLLSTYAGVIADRYERTRIMVASALACLVISLVLAALIAAQSSIGLVLGAHALLAVCGTFYRPAAQGVVPESVPEKDLAAANALFGVLEALVVVVGPALAGLLLLTGEPALGVLLNAVTFLLAAFLVYALRLRSTGSAGEEGGGLRAQIGAGLSALRSEPVA